MSTAVSYLPPAFYHLEIENKLPNFQAFSPQASYLYIYFPFSCVFTRSSKISFSLSHLPVVALHRMENSKLTFGSSAIDTICD